MVLNHVEQSVERVQRRRADTPAEASADDVAGGEIVTQNLTDLLGLLLRHFPLVRHEVHGANVLP
jgi:hypothetical protein